MLSKNIQRLLSAAVIGMSIYSLPMFSLTASAATNESSNVGTADASNSGSKSVSPYEQLMDKTPIEPTKVFDNLYFIGSNGVGSWLVNTSDGLILIDAMRTIEDAEDIIIPGIKKLGFDPANIKYILVTHGHGDHYGAAQYIHNNYGAPILMSADDWNYMNTHSTEANGPEFPKPTTHTDITDGEKLTLGDTSITIVSTPGHTPGGVSLIIPVTDNGTKHMVGMWGGTGLPQLLEDNEKYLNSLDYFAKFTDAAQVDAEITAHPFTDNSIERLETLRNRKSGDPNPYVIGQDGYKAYMDKMKIRVTDNIKKLEEEK
ncbi:MBL fold metallo-hydrolase [Clostridium saccharobutylicum]|uniref:Zn-dependent hydrolase n=1 Tax=Clostridium saccharobutylicum DSM 13864 TaxID=1345695 RepID=U5MVK8_CLOSA|nr:MBL fold metallo-hydrolase [Clostridium saccharobutylicum]AGX44568.1 Zn-dependent hydrolase [Clostridium saccharobutylicum DSM 13864]AQR91858.1 metallo-beta-lactamase L1 precursor [Clostridium saccharobutylicum]AQS11364.1 metallo-beta-lactamase L1 precursor [Clostridium saccharobutylicum]MBA2906568.1 metallo-beta-lactamase class B [Clostridium saccharobutylicum]MBA8791100.1 metallo-beta-lactamase class B [Clostridium saccharobutylicum]